MLTNRQDSFKNSRTIETGLSDHHKLIISVLTAYFKKKEPVKINYRSYKNFDQNISEIIFYATYKIVTVTQCSMTNLKIYLMQVLNDHAPKNRR